MADIASSDSGSRIVVTTSSDTDHPPEHMIDGKGDTFWTTTGMYPQEFILKFSSIKNVNKVHLESHNIKSLVIEKTTQSDPLEFEPLDRRDVQDGGNSAQQIDVAFRTPVTATHLKFVIHDGFDHFCAVNRLLVDGNDGY